MTGINLLIRLENKECPLWTGNLRQKNDPQRWRDYKKRMVPRNMF